jgi:hypothetical protein
LPAQAARKATVDAPVAGTTSIISPRSVVQAIYRESGFWGYWAGLIPSLVLISNPTIQYMLYEQLLRAFRLLKQRWHVLSNAKDGRPGQDPVKSSHSVYDGQPTAVEAFTASALAKVSKASQDAIKLTLYLLLKLAVSIFDSGLCAQRVFCTLLHRQQRS